LDGDSIDSSITTQTLVPHHMYQYLVSRVLVWINVAPVQIPLRTS